MFAPEGQAIDCPVSSSGARLDPDDRGVSEAVETVRTAPQERHAMAFPEGEEQVLFGRGKGTHLAHQIGFVVEEMGETFAPEEVVDLGR